VFINVLPAFLDKIQQVIVSNFASMDPILLLITQQAIVFLAAQVELSQTPSPQSVWLFVLTSLSPMQKMLQNLALPPVQLDHSAKIVQGLV